MGLGGRLALTFAGLLAVTALVIGAASYVTTNRELGDDVDRFLEDRAREIADGQRDGPRSGGGRGGRDELVLAVEPDAEVQLLDEDGTVVASSGIVLPVDARDVELADRAGPERIRTVDIDGTDYRVITKHVAEGAVQVARSLEDTNSLAGALRGRLLLIAAVMAAVGGLVGWVLARRTTKPLRSLTAAVDAVADTQDFTVPVDADGTDEVARLAQGFDRMLTALETSREQQRRLVADAAHELRTPLTSIKANIDWLARADGLDLDTRRETLDSVRGELAQLNDVIGELIDLAVDRHELPPFADVDLADVAGAAVSQFRSRIDRPVDFHPTSTIVRGDADTLGRAISNLLSNADKYSPPGAAVGVEVGAGAVWVSDAGEGIPAADRDLVFDRFYRRPQDRAEPGSGLGLAIVASVVEAHGGRVAITDAAVGGARVGFVLDAV